MVLVRFRLRNLEVSDFESEPIKVYFNGVHKPSNAVSLQGGYQYDYNVNEPIKIKIEINDDVPLAFDPDKIHELEFFNMNTGNDDVYNFTISDDRMSIESDDLISGISGFVNFNLFTYDRVVEQVSDYPFIHIYDISESELNQLAKSNIYSEINQLDKYIVRLNRIPFDITHNEKQNIQLGSSEVSIQANKVSESEQTIDLGKIKIPDRVHQEVGYKNIQVLLYVPYFDPIPLETEYYLGSEIQIKLTINLLSGMGTLNVYNSVLDSESEDKPMISGDEWVSYTKQMMVGDQIPYEIGDRLDLKTGLDRLLTDYEIPYIEVKTLVPDNEVDYRKLEILEIDETKDYLKSSKPYISGKMSIREQELIKSLMSRGVLINK